MPLTSLGSWLSTMRDFRLHWLSVNTFLEPSQLVLPGGFANDDFADEEDAVNAAIGAVPIAASNDRMAASDLLIAKGRAKERIKQFHMAVELHLKNTRFAGRAPATPNITDGETTYRDRADAMDQLWVAINQATDLPPFVPPLLLRGAYSQANWASEMVAFKALFGQEAALSRLATDKRSARNVLLPPMRARMHDYRPSVLLALEPNNPLVDTIPHLAPPEGTTPPALVVAGQWDNALLRAVFDWPQSQAPGLTKIQARGCTGGQYKNDEEEIIADLAPTDTHFETDWGLTAPGAIISVKFYVMNSYGNENGGKAVHIVRPAT